MKILFLAKQMYPGQTDLFLNLYEEAVKIPFGYVLIDLKTTTQDNCRLRINVPPNDEGFNQAGLMTIFLKNTRTRPEEIISAIPDKHTGLFDSNSILHSP